METAAKAEVVKAQGKPGPSFKPRPGKRVCRSEPGKNAMQGLKLDPAHHITTATAEECKNICYSSNGPGYLDRCTVWTWHENNKGWYPHWAGKCVLMEMREVR